MKLFEVIVAVLLTILVFMYIRDDNTSSTNAVDVQDTPKNIIQNLNPIEIYLYGRSNGNSYEYGLYVFCINGYKYMVQRSYEKGGLTQIFEERNSTSIPVKCNYK